MLTKINNDIKEAMRTKNNYVRDILRVVLSKAKLIAKNDKDRDIEDSDILNSIRRQIKQNKETIVYLKNDNRDTSKEDNEIEILSNYLPKQLSKEAMHEIVRKIIDDIPEDMRNLKSKGVVMGKLSKYKDTLDMKDAGAFANTLLD